MSRGLGDVYKRQLHKRFVIGVDRSKMRLFDVEDNQQTLIDDTPVFDKTSTGKRFADFKL